LFGWRSRHRAKTVTPGGSALTIPSGAGRTAQWILPGGFSREFVTVQSRYGASFAVQVQIWLSITRVAVQI